MTDKQKRILHNPKIMTICIGQPRLDSSLNLLFTLPTHFASLSVPNLNIADQFSLLGLFRWLCNHQGLVVRLLASCGAGQSTNQKWPTLTAWLASWIIVHAWVLEQLVQQGVDVWGRIDARWIFLKVDVCRRYHALLLYHQDLCGTHAKEIDHLLSWFVTGLELIFTRM